MPVLKAKVAGNWVEVGAAPQVAPSFTKLYNRGWPTAYAVAIDGWNTVQIKAQTAGGNFDTANNRWVCPASGYYKVSAMVGVHTAQAGNRLMATIYVNGLEASRGND